MDMTMTSKYPLDVNPLFELESGRHTIGYFSKGHHDLEFFASELWASWSRGITDLKNVRFEYWRCVPFGDGKYQYVPTQAGRGAFPVTVVDEEDTVKAADYEQH